MSLKVCRLCLDENDLLSNIFDNQRKIQKHSLIECIEYISKIKITNEDKYSILICHKCNYLVEQSFCFLRKIQFSNDILLQTDLTAFIDRKQNPNTDDDSIVEAVNDENNENMSEIEELVEQFEDEQCGDDITVKEEYLLDDYNLIEEVDEEKEFEVEDGNEPYSETLIEDEDSVSQSQQSALNQLLKINDPSKMYKCEICLQLCPDSRLNGILEHYTLHTTIQNWKITFDNKMNFFCDYCQENFNDISQLFIHLRKHLNIRPYNCQYCTVKKSCFFTESHLIIHIQKYHKKSPIEATSYHCSYCSKKLHSSTSLKLHEKRHLETGSVKCDFCPKTFYFKSELKRHIQIHTGEKLYECDICNKKFSSQPEVNRHRKYHTNERRFKCEFCDKRFIESGHLMGHRNFVHLNKKNFECESCNKKFLTKYKLKRHQKTRSCEMISVLKYNHKNPDDEPIDMPKDVVEFEEDIHLEKIDTLDNSQNLLTINNIFGNETEGRQFKVIGIQNGNEIQDYFVIESAETNEEMIKDEKEENYSVNGNSTIINDVHHYVIDDVNSFINWDKVI